MKLNGLPQKQVAESVSAHAFEILSLQRISYVNLRFFVCFFI